MHFSFLSVNNKDYCAFKLFLLPVGPILKDKTNYIDYFRIATWRGRVSSYTIFYALK